MTGERGLRLRAAVADNQAAIALALVGLVVAGSWLAGVAYVAPGTTTEERVTSSWHRTSTFSHAATVTRPVGVFDPGRRLVNRSLYFTRAAPVVNATYAVQYGGTDGFEGATEGSVDVAVRLDLVRRAVEEDGDVLWRTERRLAERNATGVPPGQPVAVSTAVNASAAAARTRQLVDRLGASPGTTETKFVAGVQFAGTVDGRREVRSFTHEVDLAVSGATYRLTGGHRSTSPPVEYRTTVERERPYGPAYRVGGPAALAVGLAGFVGLAWGRLRGTFAITDRERAWLAYRRDRAEFDDWVHDVEPPAEVADRPRATAASLGDLVDLAIDVDAAVVSPDDRTYVVVHDGFRYVYEAPPEPTSGAAPRRRALDEGDAEAAADAGETGGTGNATGAGGAALAGTAPDAGGDDADPGGDAAAGGSPAAEGGKEGDAADADGGDARDGDRPDRTWGDVADWPDGLDAADVTWTDGVAFPVEFDDASGLEFPADDDRDGPF